MDVGIGCTACLLWLAFTPAYSRPRGSQTARLGAHAFRGALPQNSRGELNFEEAAPILRKPV